MQGKTAKPEHTDTQAKQAAIGKTMQIAEQGRLAVCATCR